MSGAAASGVGASGRVTLRPLEAEAAPDCPWLAEAVGAVQTYPPAPSLQGGGAIRADASRPDPFAHRSGEGPTSASAFVLHSRWPNTKIDIISCVEECVGFLCWHMSEAGEGGSGDELVIVALAVRADRRNLGYGAEAVAALEARVGAARAYAAVPRANGLAVYFWLHAGYRPVRVDEAPERARDPASLWMVRTLAG